MNPILRFYYETTKVAGTFFCEGCNHEDKECDYNQKAKIARWKCGGCGKINIVEEVEFHE